MKRLKIDAPKGYAHVYQDGPLSAFVDEDFKVTQGFTEPCRVLRERDYRRLMRVVNAARREHDDLHEWLRLLNKAIAALERPADLKRDEV